MAPWLRFLEAWAVQQLLRTPAFHRVVEKVARQVHRVRHGIPPEEMGGTKIEQSEQSGFMKHFVDEIKTQLGAAERQQAQGGLQKRPADVKSTSVDARQAGHQQAVDESADAVWQTAQKNAAEPPRQGFMGQYMAALREQVRGEKSGGNR